MSHPLARSTRAIRSPSRLSVSESPYLRWNLRRNPFGELSREERAELAVVDDLNVWLQILAQPRSALQFVGDCGFGKTTHLLALQLALPGSVYVYYPQRGRRPSLPSVRPVVVDEAQRMGWWQQCRLLRGPGPVVLGTHVDLARQLGLAGFKVTTVDVERPKSADALSKILNRRIDASIFDPNGEVALIDNAFAEQLLQRFGSNVRRIEHFLYDRFQQCVLNDAPWPRGV
jgi:hypothetical protein